jgi:mercuric ion binding protein
MKKISIITVSIFILASSLFSKTIDIEVSKMHCPLCTTMVKKAIQKVDGVESVKVKLNTKNAHVVFDEKKTNIDEILKSIEPTGYRGSLVR